MCEPLARAVAYDRLPLTQLRLGSTLPSLHNPLPQGERENCYLPVQLPARPIAGAFFDEGGHAFFLVFGAEQAVEQAAFKIDTLL